jgi:hypothetical protein
VFWVWDNPTQSYQQISANASSANAGQGTSRGFWLFSESSGTLSYRGTRTESRTVSLGRGWNVIGLPRIDSVQTDQLTVSNGANEEFLSEAGCDDLPATDPSCLLFSFVFRWVGSYTSLDVSQVPVLQPERAYWIYLWTPVTLDFFPLSNEGP